MGLRRTKGGGTYKIQNQAALLQRREGRRCEEDGGPFFERCELYICGAGIRQGRVLANGVVVPEMDTHLTGLREQGKGCAYSRRVVKETLAPT